MMRYRDFAPTSFDVRGLYAGRLSDDVDEDVDFWAGPGRVYAEHPSADRGNWLVGPVSRTRDSGTLDVSNWESLCRILDEQDPSSEHYEIHRFGHWGPGWFEIALISPVAPYLREIEEIEGALSDYPVLDEEDLSRREWEEECDAT